MRGRRSRKPSSPWPRPASGSGRATSPAVFLDTWAQRLRDNANRFGPARDLDVFRTELLDPVAPDGLIDTAAYRALVDAVDAERHAAHALARRALDPDEQGRIVIAFRTELLALPAAARGDGLALTAFARERLTRARRHARKRFEAAASLEPAQLHRLRIAMKELRYAVEFFAPLFERKAVERYLERVTRAQTTLGVLQDLAVARSRLEAWTRQTPSLALACGFVLGWHGPRHARLRSQVLDDTRPALWGRTPWKRG